MKLHITHFVSDESGASAIEYGLVAAILSIAIVGGLTLTKPELPELYGKINAVIASATK